MIKSMTGFASITRDDETAAVTVTVRAVNHRYLDMQVRLPGAYADLEQRVRSVIQEHVGRGRIELAVSLQSKHVQPVAVEVNEPVIEALTGALERLRARGLVQGRLLSGDLLRVPQAISVRERSADAVSTPADVADAVLDAVGKALRALDAMRVREGDFLRADLDTRRSAMERLVSSIASAAEAGRTALETRLLERARELARDIPIEPAALAQEVVRAAARSDISEEIVRLRGHLSHWQSLAQGGEPCGRKLDFLLQEMNREVNTIGAKIEGTGAPELVVEAKAELEKMREQAQNVE